MNGAISSALSGLAAATKRVAAAASNIANIGTTGSLEPGGRAPYTPLDVQLTSQAAGGALPGGVSASFVPRDPASIPVYDPNSPFANAEGLVATPNVDLAVEAVNLKAAEIAYKANLASIKTADAMTDELLKAFDKRV